MKKLTILLIGLLLFTVFSHAQISNKVKDIFEKQTGANVTLNEHSGVPEFIRFPSKSPLELEGSSILEKAHAFINNNKTLFNFDDVSNKMIKVSAQVDTYGFKKVTINQEYKGVPIYDGILRFHFNKQDKLTSINGHYIPNIKLNPTPSLTASKAEAIAINAVDNQKINNSGESLKVNKNKLCIFPKGLVQGQIAIPYLAYEVEVRNDLDVREFVFVDAHTGAIIEQFTGIAHALDRIIYEENQGNVVWEEGDPITISLTIWQRNEIEASGHMYHFFNNAFGYESYDGSGAQMRTINNNPNIACPNANWNGVTANYCDGTASDDVIAHEWGHAYTEYTSGLIYAWQSGAINESYSDIWGETIDLLNNYEDSDDDNSLRTAGCGSSDRWRIGEDATAFSSPIRDMWNPPCNGDPGKVTDGDYWCNSGDSGGVHINSGIPNHAYALLVDGGDYNGQSITGIGFTKAAHIFWRAQSTYLTATSDFNALADALESACTDLIGINLEALSTTSTPGGLSGEIITTADYDELVKAILAVELRINPDACNFEPILEPTPDLCEAATTNPVFLEDWESSIDDWTITELPTNPSTWESRPWVLENTLPQDRAGQGIFASNPVNGDCNTDLQNGIVRLESPVITLPDYADGVFEMAFYHFASTELKWDGGNLKYSINDVDWEVVPSDAFVANPYNDVLNPGDNPMQNEPAFTGSDEGSVSSSWGKSIIDLSLIGLNATDSVRFRWEFGSDGCNGRVGWYLDDIVIYNCAKPLSMNEYKTLANSIEIFPNPSNGLFTLKKTAELNLDSARVYDINGRFVKGISLSDVSTKKTIDISKFASGIYFMKVISKQNEITIKLIKH